MRQAPPHLARAGAAPFVFLLLFSDDDDSGAPAQAPTLFSGAVRGRAPVRDAVRGRGGVLGAEPAGRRDAVLAAALRGEEEEAGWGVFGRRGRGGEEEKREEREGTKKKTQPLQKKPLKKIPTPGDQGRLPGLAPAPGDPRRRRAL